MVRLGRWRRASSPVREPIFAPTASALECLGSSLSVLRHSIGQALRRGYVPGRRMPRAVGLGRRCPAGHAGAVDRQAHGARCFCCRAASSSRLAVITVSSSRCAQVSRLTSQTSQSPDRRSWGRRPHSGQSGAPSRSSRARRSARSASVTPSRINDRSSAGRRPGVRSPRTQPRFSPGGRRLILLRFAAIFTAPTERPRTSAAPAAPSGASLRRSATSFVVQARSSVTSVQSRFRVVGRGVDSGLCGQP